MDAIEALDDGANAHFTWMKRENPGIVAYMQIGYYLSSYVAIAVLFAIIVLILLAQRRNRAVVAVVGGYAAAFGVVALLQWLVPRARPQLSVEWLGEEAKIGSYPAAAVFLFMLSAILLCSAFWNPLRSFLLRGILVNICALLCVWVCMSQFLLATHYVSDVIGAAAGAALIGWFTCRLIQLDKGYASPASRTP
jgi:membrane-associated phospholipid phosphatase